MSRLATLQFTRLMVQPFSIFEREINSYNIVFLDAVLIFLHCALICKEIL